MKGKGYEKWYEPGDTRERVAKEREQPVQSP